MPSFYRVAAPPGSNGNKASSSKTKPAKVRHRSTSPGSGAAGRTDHRATNVREARETSPTNNNKHKPEAVTKIGVTGKNERGKGKDSNLQRHQVSEHTRASKGLKVEGKAKTRSHGSINEVSRKSIKTHWKWKQYWNGLSMNLNTSPTERRSNQDRQQLFFISGNEMTNCPRSTDGNSIFPTCGQRNQQCSWKRCIAFCIIICAERLIFISKVI
ncbi:hypothetical protein OIU77_014226 [Salix suchowensis]|uniref:Uncharacterized protein n=1 Tax=Salix suchowensis TaxID=1278906 RepID=A0ABQ8ZXE6_9ROSI|nr:hypothetical protein OIU77_014226 [Salix suchowensis]